MSGWDWLLLAALAIGCINVGVVVLGLLHARQKGRHR